MSKVHLRKKNKVRDKASTQRIAEDQELLVVKNSNLLGSESDMTLPGTLTQPEYSRKYNVLPHDIDIVDKRLEDDYKDKEVYSNWKEAGAFKKCYVTCGKIPKNICCLCAPCGCGPIKTISQGEIGILIRFGKVHKKLSPGLHTINSCTDKLIVLDMRLNTIKSTQTFTTKDNLTVKISSFGTWRITHPEIFMFKVDDVGRIMREMIAGQFCTSASKNTLDELMLNREEIEDESLNVINSKSINFGF